jgi:hypothetical protein
MFLTWVSFASTLPTNPLSQTAADQIFGSPVNLRTMEGGLQQKPNIVHIGCREFGFLQPLDGNCGVFSPMDLAFKGTNLSLGNPSPPQFVPDHIPGSPRFIVGGLFFLFSHGNCTPLMIFPPGGFSIHYVSYSSENLAKLNFFLRSFRFQTRSD